MKLFVWYSPNRDAAAHGSPRRQTLASARNRRRNLGVPGKGAKLQMLPGRYTLHRPDPTPITSFIP